MKTHWIKRYLELAEFVSRWSKDESTKVGSVIVSPKNEVVSLGFNGFPKGDPDRPEDYNNREFKYSHILHSETNSLLFAKRDVSGCNFFIFPFAPCSRCASMIVQAGIANVYAPKLVEGSDLWKRWQNSIKQTELTFLNAGVNLYYVDLAKENTDVAIYSSYTNNLFSNIPY